MNLRWKKSKNIMNIPNFTKNHADIILANVDVEKIRARKFKVAVDMINASACVMDPYLFRELGVEYVAINETPNGKFTHMPEPIKENLADICALVKSSGSDVGFAHDPDADRLVIINEKGEYISEEYTLAFGIEDVLSKNPGRNVVVNMSTSQMSADIVESHGSKCFRTKVGEANVFAGIDEHNAIIGGEGGSGCIYPAINNCRDGFVSMTLALELLANRGQTVSEVVETLPKYFMKKDKWSVEGKNLEELYKKLSSHFSNAKTNYLDGIRLDLPDQSWIHLRPSLTEPIIRMFGEAKTPERVEELFEEAKKVII
jgi:phosphomannomutase